MELYSWARIIGGEQNGRRQAYDREDRAESPKIWARQRPVWKESMRG